MLSVVVHVHVHVHVSVADGVAARYLVTYITRTQAQDSTTYRLEPGAPHLLPLDVPFTQNNKDSKDGVAAEVAHGLRDALRFNTVSIQHLENSAVFSWYRLFSFCRFGAKRKGFSLKTNRAWISSDETARLLAAWGLIICLNDGFS
eukprot:6792179-Prymnesium_polylepis.1